MIRKPFHKEVAYSMGEWVYYLPGREPCRGIILGISFDIGGGTLYRVAWENKSETSHYEHELSTYFEPPPFQEDGGGIATDEE